MTTKGQASKAIRRHVVYRSVLTGQFFFAPKVEEMTPGIWCVRGKKYDVTADLQPFLLKKFRMKPKRATPAGRETP